MKKMTYDRLFQLASEFSAPYAGSVVIVGRPGEDNKRVVFIYAVDGAFKTKEIAELHVELED